MTAKYAPLEASIAAGIQVGPYYWLPLPGRGWELATFPEREFGAKSHREVWSEAVRRLARRWNKSPDWLLRRLRDHYYAVPRGRVAIMRGQRVRTVGIAHGGDSPVRRGLDQVMRAFNLTLVEVRFYIDDHEQMLDEDQRALQRALGEIKGLIRAVDSSGAFDPDA